MPILSIMWRARGGDTRKVGVALCLLLVLPGLASCGGSPSLASLRQAAAKGFGRLSSTLDPSRAVSVHYNPSSTKPTTLTATDAKGTSWRLAVPPGATLAPTTITMTPFATVAGPVGTHLGSGVRFSPDGLIFTAPATLTVTPPAGAPAAPLQIYTSPQDGSGLSYAAMTGKDRADIFHFSEAASGRRAAPDPQDLYLQVVLAAATGLADAPNSDLGPPPSVSLDCIPLPAPETADPSVEAFAEDAMQPEATQAQQLVAAMMASLASTDPATPAWRVIAGTVLDKLFDRIAERISTSVDEHDDDGDAFVALAAAAQTLDSVETETLLPVPALSGPHTPLLAESELRPKIGEWATRLATKALDEVRSSHRYSELDEIGYLEESAEQFGADTSQLEEEIGRAYAFDLDIDEQMSAALTPAGTQAPDTGNAYLNAFTQAILELGGNATVEGTVPIDSVKDVGSDLTMTGTGDLDYKALSVDASFGFRPASLPTFPTTVDATFSDLCTDPTISLSQSAYGTTETLVNPQTTVTETMMQESISGLVGAASKGGDSVDVPIADGQASATKTLDLNDVYPGLSPLFGLTLTYTLDHTPS